MIGGVSTTSREYLLFTIFSGQDDLVFFGYYDSLIWEFRSNITEPVFDGIGFVLFFLLARMAYDSYGHGKKMFYSWHFLLVFFAAKCLHIWKISKMIFLYKSSLM